MRHDDVARAHPSQDARVGVTVAGRYRIEERIAAGGFGAIYRATDVVTGAAVALKVLHAHLVSDAAIVERFVREAELLRELRGPQAISVHGSGLTTGGAPYLAMELLAGETLHARFLARGRLPWREVVTIARGVCAALAEPHALGIVHRDLKPANIFLEASEQVRVLDFGIAKHVERGAVDGDLTRQGELVGTLDYMAPEQIVGSHAAPHADIFTLGTVMYEMIAGVRPFAETGEVLGQLAALLGGDPAPLGRHAPVPAGLERIIARCLHREPSERYATVGQLADALAQLDDDLDTADTFANGLSIEEEDTWIGELPLAPSPPLATAPLARRRFAEGTAGDASPFATPISAARGSTPVLAPEPAPRVPELPPPHAPIAMLPPAPTTSLRAQAILGVLTVIVGATAAFLAVAC